MNIIYSLIKYFKGKKSNFLFFELEIKNVIFFPQHKIYYIFIFFIFKKFQFLKFFQNYFEKKKEKQIIKILFFEKPGKIFVKFRKKTQKNLIS